MFDLVRALESGCKYSKLEYFVFNVLSQEDSFDRFFNERFRVPQPEPFKRCQHKLQYE